MKSVFQALLWLAPVLAWAETPAKSLFVDGDPKAGEARAAVCAGCHGPGGDSAMPDWPKLAGQHAGYLNDQLAQYQSGARGNPIMLGQVIHLSERDRRDLAAYYAAQKHTPGLASEEAVAIAQPIYRAGVAESGVPACAACHGPTGAGNPASGYPRLGGQHAAYTAAQLRAYQTGQRAGSTQAQMMAAIAKNLSEEEIDALASYLSGLQ